jgi:hypothetical protein
MTSVFAFGYSAGELFVQQGKVVGHSWHFEIAAGALIVLGIYWFGFAIVRTRILSKPKSDSWIFAASSLLSLWALTVQLATVFLALIPFAEPLLSGSLVGANFGKAISAITLTSPMFWVSGFVSVMALVIAALLTWRDVRFTPVNFDDLLFSSRRRRLDHSFLAERLRGAQGYDRIAGFFSSSILEVAGEELESVSGTVRPGLQLDHRSEGRRDRQEGRPGRHAPGVVRRGAGAPAGRGEAAVPAAL